MDAQQQHDQEMLKRGKVSPGSRKRLEASLAAKSGSSSKSAQSTGHDPIEVAMRNHPGLTREKAEEMARAFGF